MVERLFDLAGTAVEVVRSDGFVADGTINGGEDVEKLVGEEFDMDGGWMQGTDLMIFDAQGDGLAVNDELWDFGMGGLADDLAGEGRLGGTVFVADMDEQDGVGVERVTGEDELAGDHRGEGG